MKNLLFALLLLLSFNNIHDIDLPSQIQLITTKNILLERNDVLYVIPSLYHAIEAQCDADPHITANGSHIDLQNPEKHRWVALSRNLIRTGLWHKERSGYNPSGVINFGDTIKVSNADKFNGLWVVVDSMNKRYKNRIDFLVNETITGFDFTNSTVIITI
jgi:hypothetical protein